MWLVTPVEVADDTLHEISRPKRDIASAPDRRQARRTRRPRGSWQPSEKNVRKKVQRLEDQRTRKATMGRVAHGSDAKRGERRRSLHAMAMSQT